MLTQQKINIEKILKESLRNKFQNYNPEPAVMPFHTRLLGKDRMALFSFIHILYDQKIYNDLLLKKVIPICLANSSLFSKLQ